MLFGVRKKGDELVRGRTKVPYAAIGRQRADVQQDSGRTLELHIWIISAVDQVSR
jgi:hypothetical protein